MGRPYSPELFMELRSYGVEHITFAEDGSVLSVTYADTVAPSVVPDAGPGISLGAVHQVVENMGDPEPMKDMLHELIRDDAEDIVQRYRDKLNYGT